MLRLKGTQKGFWVALLCMTALLWAAGSVLSSSTSEPIVVILPGREQSVMAWLSPLFREGFAGQSLGDVSIARNDIRVAIQGKRPDSCPDAPTWMTGPAALEITFLPNHDGVAAKGHRHAERRSGEAEAAGIRLSWLSCAPVTTAWDAAARLWAERLGSTYMGDIWTTITNAVPGPGRGIVSPVASWLGQSVVTGVYAAWTIAWIVTASVGWLLPMSKKRTRYRIQWAWLWAAIWVLVGISLRFATIQTAPIDGDEGWALPTHHAILADDHDAWVHPPLHRATQQAWDRAIDWHYLRLNAKAQEQPATGMGMEASTGLATQPVTREALAWIRAPSLTAGILSLFLVVLAWLRAPRLWTAPALILVSASPILVADGCLARPYALASLWVVIVATALWRERPGRLEWWTALVAAGLAAWTDVLAGAIAGGLIVFATVSAKHLGWWRRAALCAAFALWLAPLVPGIWTAAHDEITPDPAVRMHSDAIHVPDLRPEYGDSSHPLWFFATMIRDTVFGGASSGLAIVLGVVGLAALGYMGYRIRRSSHVAALYATGGLLVIASMIVGLRSRHLLAWTHLVALAWVVVPTERKSL